MSDLPCFILDGGPRERGLAHGQLLRERIHRTFDFYQDHLFRNSPLSAEQIRSRAEKVKQLIGDFNADYVIEIEAIAEAAGMESWKLYALNARTEILNAPLAECTSLYFRETALLGQTWDWIREMEDLIVVLQYRYADGRNIITLTEPGMLAKIGLNNAGLGVCLNILLSAHELNGVPVHVLLRAILECATLDAARRTIIDSGCGKSSHFLVGDAQGHCFGMEFAAGSYRELAPQKSTLVHTNHCLGPGLHSTMIPGSAERLEQAQEDLHRLKGYTLEDMQDILLNDVCDERSIQVHYHPEAMLGGLQVGTCATVLMDLAGRKLYARKGPGRTRDFSCYERNGNT